MSKVKSLVVAIAMLAAPAMSMAATALNITVGGSDSMVIDIGGAATTAAPVALALEGRINSDGQMVGGYQHALKASNPALWMYGNPSVTLQAPFAAANLFQSPAAGSDLPGAVNGEISVFDFQAEFGPFNNAHVETINVVSKAPLAKGVYTFTFGDSGQGFFMVNNATGEVPWGSVGTFTLNVVPEPASALLLLSALPFLRRRKVS